MTQLGHAPGHLPFYRFFKNIGKLREPGFPVFQLIAHGR
jgi:hypothetical protein